MLLAVFALARNAEIHGGAFLMRQFAQQVLGGPDSAETREFAQAGSMVDGVPEHGEFHAGCGLKRAEPLLALVQPRVQVQLVEPVLAQLPLLADFPDFRFQFLRARKRIENVVAVGLRQKIVDHAVADMLAVGPVVLPEYRPHRGPDLVDQFEVLLRWQLRADLDRVLQIRHQHRQRGEDRQAFSHQVANHHVPLAQKIEQRGVILLRRNIDDKYPFPEKGGEHPPVFRGAGQVSQFDREIEDGFSLQGDDRLVVEPVRKSQRLPVQTVQQREYAAFGQAVLGEREMDAQQLGAEITRFFRLGLKQQEKQVACFAVRRQGIEARENALARRVVVPSQLEVVIHHVSRMGNVLERESRGAPIFRRGLLCFRAGHGRAICGRRNLIGRRELPPRLDNSYARRYLRHGQPLLFQSLDIFYPAYRFVRKVPHQLGITFLRLRLPEHWLRPVSYTHL